MLGRAGIAVVTLAMMVGSARADVKHSNAEEPMREYFSGEKYGGLTLMAMGVAGIGGGAYLTTRDDDFENGLSYPLLGIGIVHVAAGVFVILTSHRRIKKSLSKMHDDHAGFVDEERKRVKSVKLQFLVLKIVEGVLIAGGVGLAVWANSEGEERDTLKGVGIGVAIEAAATLLFDIVASRRASRYIDRLGALSVRVVPDAGGHGVLTASVGFRF